MSNTILRPTKVEYFAIQAMSAAMRASCIRRRVGCVLVDKHDHVMATGYNGPASSMPNCTDEPCPGAKLPSGTGLTSCMAIHAEANALMQCADVQQIEKAYVTASPCVECTKMLLNTSCKEIIFLQEYPHGDAIQMWLYSGREIFSVKTLIKDDSMVYSVAKLFGFEI